MKKHLFATMLMMVPLGTMAQMVVSDPAATKFLGSIWIEQKVTAAKNAEIVRQTTQTVSQLRQQMQELERMRRTAEDIREAARRAQDLANMRITDITAFSMRMAGVDRNPANSIPDVPGLPFMGRTRAKVSQVYTGQRPGRTLTDLWHTPVIRRGLERAGTRSNRGNAGEAAYDQVQLGQQSLAIQYGTYQQRQSIALARLREAENRVRELQENMYRINTANTGEVNTKMMALSQIQEQVNYQMEIVAECNAILAEEPPPAVKAMLEQQQKNDTRNAMMRASQRL